MKAQSDDEAHAKGVMLRNTRYKYVCRITREDELYDLQEDPGETTNCIADPALDAVLTEMRIQLMRWMVETADVVPLKRDERFTPEMLWARVCGLVPEGHEQEVCQKIAEGISFPMLMGYCRSLQEKHSRNTDQRYKWIRNWNDLYELYDLRQDPQELYNLIHECPEIAARMAALTYRH